MSTDPRKIGGDNNKRGNRYEDLFVIFRLLEYAPSVILDGCPVRLKEQAGCHVDDLLVVTPKLHRFHQLKADKAITWSAKGNKLTKEFLAQKAACQQIGRACELVVVVADPASWWVDRGYFDWEFPPADNGLFKEPCHSESFRRFVDRIITDRPSTFADFEKLLP